MTKYKYQLLIKQFDHHRRAVNSKILSLITFFLAISLVWNSLFSIFSLPYSRANLKILISCGICFAALYYYNKRFEASGKILQHFILASITLLSIALYFGSGYTEGWTFFLIIPLVSGVYGNRGILFFYSALGLLAVSVLEYRFPVSHIHDSIDISNSILIYVIVTAFSYLLFETFLKIYSKQVNIVVESMENTVAEVVNSFNVAIEAKDDYTFGHSERVSKYAVALAKLLPEYQDPQRLKSLRLSGLLHDVGKINVPESILIKPDRLTAEEYELIKTHTIVGARMVERIKGLGQIKEGVLYHHERWDGQGYPAKLSGTAIPLDARIIAIADAFDAMTSSRTYREAVTFESAYRTLKEHRGRQFDPQLIDLLDRIKPEFHAIYLEGQDPRKEFETITAFL